MAFARAADPAPLVPLRLQRLKLLSQPRTQGGPALIGGAEARINAFDQLADDALMNLC